MKRVLVQPNLELQTDIRTALREEEEDEGG